MPFGPSAVIQSLTARATGLLECLREHRHSSECALIVNALGKPSHGTVVPQQPTGVNQNGPIGVANNVAEQVAAPAVCLLAHCPRTLRGPGSDSLGAHSQPFLFADAFPGR